MSAPFDIGDSLVIPTPRPVRTPRGLNATKTVSPAISIRLDEATKSRIDKAATALGMTRSAFMIWCSEYTAETVLRKCAER